MPDALTLECFGCAGEAGSMICTLKGLTWILASSYISYGYDCFTYVTLAHEGTSTESVTTDGHDYLETALGGETGDGWREWYTNWNSITISLSNAASLYQFFDPQKRAVLYVKQSMIKPKYSCKLGDSPIEQGPPPKTPLYWNHDVLDTQCYLHGAAASVCNLGYGNGSIMFYQSEPFSECSGCTVVAGNFGDQPPMQLVDMDRSTSAICLCPSGGTPPYYWGYNGVLPQNVIFDVATGCLSGGTSGQAMTGSIDFIVMDSLGNKATVNCSLQSTCGRDPSGNQML